MNETRQQFRNFDLANSTIKNFRNQRDQLQTTSEEYIETIVSGEEIGN